MYFCFWSNCIESASKTEPSETIDFHVAFQSICHLVCTLCDYWFSSNAACGCFQYTDTSRNTNVFFLSYFDMETRKYYMKRTCEIHGLNIRSVGCLFSLFLFFCLLWNDVSTLFILFQYQNLNIFYLWILQTHTTIDSSTTRSLCIRHVAHKRQWMFTTK